MTRLPVLRFCSLRGSLRRAPRTALALSLFVWACSPQAPSGDTEPANSSQRAPAAPAPAVPDDRPVVVFLGTSLTAGLGLTSDEDTYVARVAELADSAGTPIRAVNAGVSGETSAGGLRRIGWVVEDTVDVLVLELGANDGLRGLDPEALAANLEAIIDSTRARWPGARIVLAGMEAPPNLGPRYTRAFREVFPRVARSREAALVPFLLEGVGGVRELNQDDGIHPTPEGHERMARLVWPVLEPVLRGAQFILGPAVEKFEGDFARYVGSRHCVGLNNGTSALQMALIACDVGPGGDVTGKRCVGNGEATESGVGEGLGALI